MIKSLNSYPPNHFFFRDKENMSFILLEQYYVSNMKRSDDSQKRQPGNYRPAPNAGSRSAQLSTPCIV